jgi:hypothetical protein
MMFFSIRTFDDKEMNPTPCTRRGCPSGLMAPRYRVQTPLAVIVSHLAFGAIRGAFYHLR